MHTAIVYNKIFIYFTIELLNNMRHVTSQISVSKKYMFLLIKVNCNIPYGTIVLGTLKLNS